MDEVWTRAEGNVGRPAGCLVKGPLLQILPGPCDVSLFRTLEEGCKESPRRLRLRAGWDSAA